MILDDNIPLMETVNDRCANATIKKLATRLAMVERKEDMIRSSVPRWSIKYRDVRCSVCDMPLSALALFATVCWVSLLLYAY